MSHNQEILASVSAASPNLRANYQGLLGYWCQADAVFIETLHPEPGAAIDKYRKMLAAGNIAVSHNAGTDSLQRLALLGRPSELESQLATERSARFESERRSGHALDTANNERDYAWRQYDQQKARAEKAETALATARQELAEQAGKHVEQVKELLAEWRDATTPTHSPGGWGLQQALLNHRAFFDMKCQQLTGRRLELGGIYAGIPAPAPAAPSPVLGGEAAAAILPASKLAAFGYEGDEPAPAPVLGRSTEKGKEVAGE